MKDYKYHISFSLKPAAHTKRKEKFVDLRWENKEGRTGLKRHEQIGDENKKRK
jgi:hypothetical protein